MSFILRVAVRPLVFAVLLTVASAGTTLADGAYGGTDPPKSGGAIAALSNIVDEAADASCFWSQLSALLAQWFTAMN